MKKFSTAVIAVSFIAAVLLLLFSIKSKPIDSLIHAPGKDGQTEQIWQVLEKAVGSDYTLKTPTDGGHRSALIYVDLNNDMNDEIVTFYSKKGASETVCLHVFTTESDSWIALAGIESGFNELNQVEFADINGDGTSEIIVGWGLQNSKLLQQVNVYEVDFETASIKSVFNTNYSSFGVFDFDNDKKSELAVIYSDTSVENSATLFRLFGFEKNEFGLISSCEVDPMITTVSQMEFDYIRRMSCSRVYIDGYTSDGLMTTDAISYLISKKKLSRVFVNGETVCSLSKRSTNIGCEDINGDGIVEIPIQVNLEYKSLSSSVIEWTDIFDGKIGKVCRYFDNRANGYCFKIPDQLQKNTIPILLSDEKTMRFYFLEKDENGLIQSLPAFEIRIEYEDVINPISTQFRLVEVYKGKRYYCRIFEAGEKNGITKKLISTNLIFS